MISFTDRINEKSTKCFFIVLRDQLTGNAVTPTSLKWTLVTEDEVVVNDREQIAIAAGGLGTAVDGYGNIATIVTLSGNDFGVYEEEVSAFVTRHLVIEGTYDGTCGTGLPVTEYIEFEIENIPYLKLATTTPSTEINVITLLGRSADPSDPDEGTTKIWMSDGVGSGDEGDILLKITAGGVTKIFTLIDFTAGEVI